MNLSKEDIKFINELPFVRTTIKDRVWEVPEKSRLFLFSFGNRKLPRSTATFSLLPGREHGTCLYSTDECEFWCYDKGTVSRFPRVYAKRNYITMLALHYPSLLEKILGHDLENMPNFVKMVRIHEGGDYFSQSYFEIWVRLAERFPQYTFYSYTKNYELDTSIAPDNIRLMLSDDKESLTLYYSMFHGVSKVVNNSIPEGYKRCPGSCKTCNICQTLTIFTKVAIPVHNSNSKLKRSKNLINQIEG